MLRPGTTAVANHMRRTVRSRLGGLGVPEPVGGVRWRAPGRLGSSRPLAGALLAALAAVALSIGVAPHSAGADVVIPGPLGPIDLPLPDPLPDPTTTTTVPEPTTTTTIPDTTTTTAAPTTTTTA